MFLEIEPPRKEPVEDGSESLSVEEKATELDTLRAALGEAKEQNETLNQSCCKRP